MIAKICIWVNVFGVGGILADVEFGCLLAQFGEFGNSVVVCDFLGL